MDLSCSTLVVASDRLDGASLVEEWRKLVGGVCSAIALDHGLDHGRQEDLLARAAAAGLRAVQLEHPRPPLQRAHTAASPLSPDPHERGRAAQELVLTLERAHRHGVRSVVVLPWLLPLGCSMPELARRFALALPLGLADLAQERAARGQPAVDALCAVLDGALQRAAALEVTVRFPCPAPWPHQVPATSELHQLLHEFRGAPLDGIFAADWQGIAEHLGTATVPPPPVRAVWLADHAGLLGGLPPGCGERIWPLAGTFDSPALLRVSPGATAPELRRLPLHQLLGGSHP